MSWIESIANGINKVLKSVRPALPAIPALLLISELKSRPGLSAIALTSAIISRLNEAGITTGVNEDGSENKINKFVRIMCEEIINEIKDNAVVNAVIEPGSVITTGTGANAGGPVTVISTNTMVSQLLGLIR